MLLSKDQAFNTWRERCCRNSFLPIRQCSDISGNSSSHYQFYITFSHFIMSTSDHLTLSMHIARETTLPPGALWQIIKGKGISWPHCLKNCSSLLKNKNTIGKRRLISIGFGYICLSCECTGMLRECCLWTLMSVCARWSAIFRQQQRSLYRMLVR